MRKSRQADRMDVQGKDGKKGDRVRGWGRSRLSRHGAVAGEACSSIGWLLVDNGQPAPKFTRARACNASKRQACGETRREVPNKRATPAPTRVAAKDTAASALCGLHRHAHQAAGSWQRAAMGGGSGEAVGKRRRMIKGTEAEVQSCGRPGKNWAMASFGVSDWSCRKFVVFQRVSE